MTDITLSTGHLVNLQPGPVKHFEGIRLPGAGLFQADQDGFVISIHEYQQRLFRLALRSFYCRRHQTITIREKSKYLRLETVLTGELNVQSNDDADLGLTAGYYRISDKPGYVCTYEASHGCEYLVVYLSPELLSQTPLSDAIVPGKPILMPLIMRNMISRLFDNPYEDRLRDGFYENTIRSLLFDHVALPPYTPPGELTATELAAIYAADRIISRDLSQHYHLNQLAKMVHTNIHTLKVGFARVYGMGPFERLMHKKMEHAKFLLETTDKQIQEISAEAGYETVTGFINSFRKLFKVSPTDWRKRSRGLL